MHDHSRLGTLHSELIRDVVRGGGAALPANLREFFEARFRCSFGAVRVHTDEFSASSSRRLGARAYTLHNHIVFAAPPDLDVLAHELAHVVQQSESTIPATLWLGDPASGIERQACAAAGDVLRGIRPRVGPRLDARGLVLRAPGLDPCPGEPAWESISAGSQEIYQPANQVIEADYLASKADHVDSILVGSQFIYGGNLEIQLPRGAPNEAFGNHLLKELRGIAQQLKPDIVDFKERVFYEIKTARDASANAAKVKNQLAHYYNLTEAIRKQYGAASEPSWNQLNATWTPHVILPLPGGGGNKFVCTSATDYSVWPNGLVLYDVRQKKKDEDRKKRRIMTYQFESRDEDATQFLTRPDRLRAAMEDFSSYYPRYLVIAPTGFWQAWKRQAGEERMRRKWEMLEVKPPPFLDPKTPIGYFHRIGWTLIGITAAGMAAGFWIPIAWEAFTAAAAAETAATAAGGTIGATVADAQVVSLAAYRALRASKVAIEISKAAGILIVLGLGHKASAGTQVTISNESAVRVVPIEDFKPFKGTWADSSQYDVPGDYVFKPSDVGTDLDVGKTVLYDSVQHTIVAQIAASYSY